MTFSWTSKLVLPEDAKIVEVKDIEPKFRNMINSSDGDFIIFRTGSRDASKVINADVVRLLNSFRKPRKVVDAIISMSRATNMPANQLLDESFSILKKMVVDGLLTVAGSNESLKLSPSFKPGEKIGKWKVEKCIRLIDDSEVYKASNSFQTVAIKLLRPRGIERGLKQLLFRELEILQKLDGTVTPEVIDHNLDEKYPWIAITWIDGNTPENYTKVKKSNMCISIANAYAHLHRQKVIHGDVHTGNILIDDQGDVHLLDFALARIPDDKKFDQIIRGAAPGFWEPEFAEAMLRKRSEIQVTFLGEQYSVSTLIDNILTGKESFQLPAAAAEQWHAVLTADRLCFVERGSPAWPSVENVLRRATNKIPQKRYQNMSVFAEELQYAFSRPPAAIAPSSDSVKSLLKEVTVKGSLFKSGLSVAPLSSFNFGSAGIAFALYRIARAREDGDLLSTAEVWQHRAEKDLKSQMAFYDVHEFQESNLGNISPYHALPGVWLTHTLLAHARGDVAGTDFAINQYCKTIRSANSDELDLTLGKSAALLGSSILYGIRPIPQLLQLGDELEESIWSKLNVEPTISKSQQTDYLGIAHGWAGYLYATLSWSKITSKIPSENMLNRFSQIQDMIKDNNNKSRMPVEVLGENSKRGVVPYMDGWCHGQAGHVFLNILASNVFGESKYLDTAIRLGETSFSGEEKFGNLCCGLGGRAYAMLSLYRVTEDKKWLDRAKILADNAQKGTISDKWPNSLYKGRVGIAVVSAEVERPEIAAMPLFEDELH